MVTTIGSMLDSEEKGHLVFSVAGKQVRKKVTVAAESQKGFTVGIKLPDDIKLWDDFTPALHDLDVKLEVDKKYSDAKSVRFGVREVSEVDKRIAINSNPFFFGATWKIVSSL